MGVYKNYTLIEQSIYGSSRLGLMTSASKAGYRNLGGKKYELSNHLGNVLAVVSDNIHLDQDFTWAQVVNVTDYYPFGLAMDGRTEKDSAYRYGFNGKENDNEIIGYGRWQDYGLRMYRPDLGKFFSVDPLTKKYPELTPYQFASNTPIQAIDLDGAEALFVHGTWSDKATWGKEFTGNMLKATGWDKVQKQAYFGNWSGANSIKAREEAANGFYKWLTSDDNPQRDLRHTTLIGHSHGGNINKTLKNKLEKDGWKVDIVNIETPQRKDFQSNNNGSGVYLNFYNSMDIVQKAGSAGSEGPTGARLDPKADKNIELRGSIPIKLPGQPLPINSITQWFKDAGGHSLHNNDFSKSIIESQTRKAFDGQKQSSSENNKP